MKVGKWGGYGVNDPCWQRKEKKGTPVLRTLLTYEIITLQPCNLATLQPCNSAAIASLCSLPHSLIGRADTAHGFCLVSPSCHVLTCPSPPPPSRCYQWKASQAADLIVSRCCHGMQIILWRAGSRHCPLHRPLYAKLPLRPPCRATFWSVAAALNQSIPLSHSIRTETLAVVLPGFRLSSFLFAYRTLL